MNEVLTTSEAAKYLGMSDAWMARQRWLGPGYGPRYIKIGRAVRYDRSDLDAFKQKSSVG